MKSEEIKVIKKEKFVGVNYFWRGALNSTNKKLSYCKVPEHLVN
jgi:hypothetical protein